MRIVRGIPFRVLAQNISRIYSLLVKYEKGVYVERLFNRHEEEIDAGKDDDYYELIIEIGFKIYSLM